MTSPVESLPSCVVLIPVYKPRLPANEEAALTVSLSNLKGWPLWFVGPHNLDWAWYREQAPQSEFLALNPQFFASARSYSQLLLNPAFYAHLEGFDYHLICQTDAVVLRPTLANFLQEDYHYWGAPWPNGWSIDLPVRIGSRTEIFKLNAFVGNGGLSLRNTQAVRRLLGEFPETLQAWVAVGNPEDLFIALMSGLSKDFKIPNLRKAAAFAIELEPERMLFLNQGELPFGAHQWDRFGLGPSIELVKGLSSSRALRD
jgi:hypothetical protein